MFNIRQFALKMSQITGYVAYWIYKTAVPQTISLLHYGDTFTQKIALKCGEMRFLYHQFADNAYEFKVLKMGQNLQANCKPATYMHDVYYC